VIFVTPHSQIVEHYFRKKFHPMPDSLHITRDSGHSEQVDSLYDCKASPELIAAFEKRAVKVACSENEVLFREGEPGKCVYLILAGEIRLFLPLTMMDGMGFRAGSGAFVGLPAAFGNESYSMSAIAREGTQVALMSRDKFCDLVAADPVLALDVLRILAAETRAARIAIVEAGIGRRTQPQANNKYWT
jgi:CRP/FNR family cyclic AMP-dependent transcriptional regulator